MIKLTKADRTLLKKYGSRLSSSAYEELERLWTMRDKLTVINEHMLPIVVQYVAVQDALNEASLTLMEAVEPIDTETGELREVDIVTLEDKINLITKLQKVAINYCKLLKLDEKIVTKSKNKFAELLLK